MTKKELEIKLKKALQILGAIYKTEFIECRGEIINDGEIFNNFDLDGLYDVWTNNSNHVTELESYTAHFKTENLRKIPLSNREQWCLVIAHDYVDHGGVDDLPKIESKKTISEWNI